MTPAIIQQKDFSTTNDINIKITSKSEADEERSANLTEVLPLANYILSRP
jgi:hypothetical protein